MPNLIDLNNYIRGITTTVYGGAIFSGGSSLTNIINISSGIGIVQVPNVKAGALTGVNISQFALVKSYANVAGNDNEGALCIYIGKYSIGSGVGMTSYLNYLTISNTSFTARYWWNITPVINTN